jgi:glycosyltransferase involved in cell wall biosynthesis
MPVKVCLVTTVHPSFDVRIFHKEAKTFVQAGYNVTLIAQHDKNEIVDGVKIIALPEARNRFGRIFGLTVWALYLALKQRADIYHFHDPELIVIGIILKLFRKKVIYDVHEDVSKQILNKDWMGNKYIREFMAFMFELIEKIGAFMFDIILTATSDIAKKFPKNKTVILRNFPILKLIDDAVPTDYKKNKAIIIYTGRLARIRGIKQIIQAMEYTDDRAELWLLGKWENEEFKKECENLKGWKYTKYLGLVSLREVYQYMKVADIGISMLFPIKNYLTSLPIKVFEYMACSLPVVMSNFPYWKKMFGECALFADPYNPKYIIKKVLYLLDNPNEAKKMGKTGKRSIEERYSWEAESKKLLNIYENL